MKKLLISIVSILALGGILHAADKATVQPITSYAGKNVAVDVQRVYQGYGLAQESEKKMKKLEQDAEAELKKMAEEINNLGKQYNDLKAKLEDEDTPLKSNAKDKMEKDKNDLEKKIRSKETDLMNRRQELINSFQEERQKIVDARASEVKTEVDKIAKILNVDHVLNSSGGMAILYSKPELDITQKVIDALNTAHPVVPSKK